MQPVKGSKTKFKQETKFVHNRSEGLTRRNNKGTRQSVIDTRKEK